MGHHISAIVLAVPWREEARARFDLVAVPLPGVTIFHIDHYYSGYWRVVLGWKEMNGPAVTPPTRKGFGTRAMGTMIRHLMGEINFDWRAEGLACEIKLDVGQVAQS